MQSVCFCFLLFHFATSDSNLTSSLAPISSPDSASTPADFAPVRLPHVWIEFIPNRHSVWSLFMHIEQCSHVEGDRNAHRTPQAADSANSDARQVEVEYCLDSNGCLKPDDYRCEKWKHCGRSCTIDSQDHFVLAHRPCSFRVGRLQTFRVDHWQVIRAPEVRYSVISQFLIDCAVKNIFSKIM